MKVTESFSGGLSHLIGIHSLKNRIYIQLKSCKKTGEIFPHSLLTGIGGCGKTAIARALGYELQYHFVENHAAPFKSIDLLSNALISGFTRSQALGCPLLFFIDEIHRLKLPLQESLYSAMQEWWVPTDKGQYTLSPFTLLGSTTRLDMLDQNSFVKRFENIWEISRYSENEISIIIAAYFSKYGFTFDHNVTQLIAKRCMGIPRIAVNLSKKIRHLVISENSNEVTESHVIRTFDLEGIDVLGLQSPHRFYLSILALSSLNGKHVPLGISSISSKMRYSEDTIKGSIEPILLELNFVTPTPKGRVITDLGSDYLENIQKSS